ncbi:hypothetical protein GIY62_26160 [Burkholderia plantarii]|uniref:hypothetical protein n=1 Tax=Burkholderia plantarii TaxID=41899 RepID=UPI00272A5347|nr:hypothetical protein [Burkholderia plantarii]WLE63750.1 hypothetical protein GIY62_26160 [Burkholderia plantarii]
MSNPSDHGEAVRPVSRAFVRRAPALPSCRRAAWLAAGLAAGRSPGIAAARRRA